MLPIKDLQSLINDGKLVEAQAALETIAEADLSDDHIPLICRIENGFLNFKDAGERAKRHLESGLHKPELFREYAAASLGLQNFPEAEKAVMLGLQLDPENVELRAILAVAEAMKGKLEKGTGLIFSAMNANPRYGEVAANAAVIANRAGAKIYGHRMNTIALALKPFLAGSLSSLGHIAVSEGRLEEAERILTRISMSAPWHWPVYRTLAHVAQRQGDDTKALDYLSRGLAVAGKDKSLNEAYGLLAFSLGRPEDAIEKLEIVTAQNAGSSTVWDVLGQSYVATKEYLDASKAFQKALLIKPARESTIYNVGVFMTLRGKPDFAEYTALLLNALQPGQSRSLVLLSDVMMRLNEVEKADAAMTRLSVIGEGPTAQALCQRAAVYIAQDFDEKAISLLQQAVEIDPDYYLSHVRLGNLFRQREDYPQALHHLKEARRLRPDKAESVTRIARVYNEMADRETSLSLLKEAVEIEPDSSYAVGTLVKQLLAMGLYDEAEEAIGTLRDLKPDSPFAIVSYGELCLSLGKVDLAITAFEEALVPKPASPAILDLISGALKSAGYPRLALAFYWRGMEHKPDSIQRKFNTALFALGCGDFANGWDLYEYGFDVKLYGRAPKRDYEEKFGLHTWDGEDLQDKKILIWMEQGIGDHIMFMSILPDLVDQGAKLMIEAESRLTSICSRSFEGASVFTAKSVLDKKAEQADYQIPVGSLPKVLRRSTDSFKNQRQQFLKADPDKVEKYRRDYKKANGIDYLIGIGWRGGKQLTRQEARSVPLRYWAPILKQKGIQFVSIQYGSVGDEIDENNETFGCNIIQDKRVNPLKDMDSSAAQIAAMDLVISATNAGVHTAGSLGVPCWTFVPFVSDWRWTAGRKDSLWYPGMRVFRKTDPFEWDPIVNIVADELKALMDGETNRLRDPSWDITGGGSIFDPAASELDEEQVKDLVEG